jgi:hypothetical protein
MMQDAISIKVKRGTKVDIKEVDTLEGDRELVAETPKNLKVAIHRVEPGGAGSASTITMCG